MISCSRFFFLFVGLFFVFFFVCFSNLSNLLCYSGLQLLCASEACLGSIHHIYLSIPIQMDTSLIILTPCFYKQRCNEQQAIHVFSCMWFFSGCIPRSEIAGLQGINILHFIKYSKVLSKRSQYLLHPQMFPLILPSA